MQAVTVVLSSKPGQQYLWSGNMWLYSQGVCLLCLWYLNKTSVTHLHKHKNTNSINFFIKSGIAIHGHLHRLSLTSVWHTGLAIWLHKHSLILTPSTGIWCRFYSEMNQQWVPVISVLTDIYPSVIIISHRIRPFSFAFPVLLHGHVEVLARIQSLPFEICRTDVTL